MSVTALALLTGGYLLWQRPAKPLPTHMGSKPEFSSIKQDARLNLKPVNMTNVGQLFVGRYTGQAAKAMREEEELQRPSRVQHRVAPKLNDMRMS